MRGRTDSRPCHSTPKTPANALRPSAHFFSALDSLFSGGFLTM